MLTKRATEILKMMIAAEVAEEHEDAEIVCEGNVCYLGHTRISKAVVNQLIRHVAVKTVSEPGHLERYTIVETGRNIVANPKVADRILNALQRGAPCDSLGNPI